MLNIHRSGLYYSPGDDVIVDLDTDFETESPLTMTLDEYANLLDVSVDEIDAIGFGIEYSGTVGGGMNTGIEAVHYLSGKDKGGIFVYDKVGGQVGLEGSIGVYGFAAYKNEDLGPASADSWLGSFSFYDAGFAIGLSGFWSNSEGKNDLWPGHHGTVDWKGVSLGGAYYSPGFNFGAKWGYSDYSYANWIGNNVHK